MIQKSRGILPGLLLIGALVALGGCGRGTGAQPGTGGQQRASGHPDSVRIEINQHGIGQEKLAVTLTVASLVQQLYATVYALPQMPQQQGCTADLGPEYALTFSEGSQLLVTADAQRYGCGPVTISGETGSRKASTDFWRQLDTAIYQGTPPAKPDVLAIAYTPHPGQAPQTARIASAETAQRLYNAILALPLLPLDQSCSMPTIPEYQLVFHTAEQVIPAEIDPTTCKTISVNAAYLARGGVHALNDEFNRLFAGIVAGATFAPAQPDKLALSISTTQTSSHQPSVGNTALVRQLYHKVLTLPPTTTQPDCLGADKAAGKGTWYGFAFSQWDLPIFELNAHEGSCLYVTRSALGQGVQGDQALWDLIHQAANQH
ncbi:MAG TPA: hypothetical protein VF510_13170 [Ktedonobacterales bacterium]